MNASGSGPGPYARYAPMSNCRRTAGHGVTVSRGHGTNSARGGMMARTDALLPCSVTHHS